MATWPIISRHRKRDSQHGRHRDVGSAFKDSSLRSRDSLVAQGPNPALIQTDRAENRRLEVGGRFKRLWFYRAVENAEVAVDEISRERFRVRHRQGYITPSEPR